MKDRLATAKRLVTFEDIKNWNIEESLVTSYGKDFSVIMIGEYHVPEVINQQLDIIRSVAPTYVLHENAKGLVYDASTQTFVRDPLRIYDDSDNRALKYIELHRQLANEIGFNIIGCDITNAEFEEICKVITDNDPSKYHYTEKERMLTNRARLDEVIWQGSKEIMPIRDKHMEETILRCQFSSEVPIVVVLGNEHAKNLHNNKALQNKGFGYLWIDQSPRFKRHYFGILNALF